MPKSTTPSYISALLKPMPGKGTDRRAWSIPLQGVWIPFFTATNTAGETAIAAEALGAPLRLQRNPDGTPKFGNTGRPVIRIVKELSDQIRIVRDNFTAGLLNYAASVQKSMPAEYKAQVEACQKAGMPITTRDYTDLTEYLELVKAAAESKPETRETEREAMPVAA